MPTDRSQVIYGFALINMKRTIAPYANKGAADSIVNGVHAKHKSQFPETLGHARSELLKQFDAFSETINRAGSARELGPAFGTASDLTKRTQMLEGLETKFEAYTQQMKEVYAKHNWCPPDALIHTTGDKTVDTLIASCQPMDEAMGGDKPNNNSNNSDPLSPANLSPYYFFWSNCLGDNNPNTGGTKNNHAIADWRYDLASMHFNMAVIYMSGAAHLTFLCGAVSWPNYFPAQCAPMVKSYAELSQVSAMEKEAYAMCCTAAYHFDKSSALMKDILGTSYAGNQNNDATTTTPSATSTDTTSASTTGAAAASNSPTDKPQYAAAGAGSTSAKTIELQHNVSVQADHVPVDMSQTFLTLMKEVMIGQGQEISIAKAIKAGREEDSVSKMSFTSLTGRLLLGAKLLFSNAEQLTQKDVVVMKAGFASFVAAIQTKAATYEAIAYAIQGAYMAVPVTSSQRMEMAILERERNGGGAPNANAIGEDAGMNPEDGLWCLHHAAELAAPIPERAVKNFCAPSVRVWADFMLTKYLADIHTNIQSLQQLGLARKASQGPVALKSAMVVARVKPPTKGAIEGNK